jgi:ABC-2 type transport system ATP-binding protein
MNESNQAVETGGEVLLRIEHLSKRYLRAQALKDISLEIRKGTVTGLLGPNGSGKSTLLKCIAGLCQPSSGKIFINGRAPGIVTKRQVAYLPEVDPLYPWMTARQTIEFVKSFYDDWDNRKEASILEIAKVDPNMPVRAMSKGQKARLRLVLTMSRNAPLILMDEPLSGIDPPSRSRILNAIVSEYSETEQAILLATHEVSEAESIFDRVIFLHEGEIRLMGDAEEIRKQHNSSIQGLLEEVYA